VAYLQSQQTNRAVEVFDRVLANPNLQAETVLVIAQVYNQIKQYGKLEGVLERLVQVAPESPEAWYDLTSMKVSLGKIPEALPAARRAIELSNRRRAANAAAPDLAASIRNNPEFAPLRASPEFQTIEQVATNK
jgi:predicted Zn-dependent protease